MPAQLIEESPVRIEQVAAGVIQIDFGRVAFGHIVFNTTAFKTSATVLVRFGEWLNKEGRIDPQAPGSFRHGVARVSCQSRSPTVPEPDPRNTTPPALPVPEHLGPLLPFRWIEIEGWPGEIRTSHIHRRTPVLQAWDSNASSFACSNARLVALWDLCKHTLRSTTYAGVYFDGDRERVSYEIDAYLSQLIHEAVDPGSSIARATFVHLFNHRTWPTEAAFHLLGMAYADWWHTGDREWLAEHFEKLQGSDRVKQLEHLDPDRLPVFRIHFFQHHSRSGRRKECSGHKRRNDAGSLKIVAPSLRMRWHQINRISLAAVGEHPNLSGLAEESGEPLARTAPSGRSHPH